MPTDRLTATFAALADPTRRAILARLALGESSVNELAKPFAMSLPAVSKHLKVLERSGLITCGRCAQWRPCRLRARPLREASEWVGGYRRFWEESFRPSRVLHHRTKENGKSPYPKKNKNQEPESDREIVISRIVDAPRELVWRAMTDPKHVVNWWGPRGFTTTIQEMDVRLGGTWKHVMHGPDGIDYPNRSTFTEVVMPERIVFSHGGSKKGGATAIFVATWTFETVEVGKARVTIRMVFPSASERDRVANAYGAIEGGRQTLERLSEHLPTMIVSPA
jgi:uncharacterized protein YndB with AHSA1/START domain/DNA-binding transcriptional ArsR family regulator